MQKVVTFDIMIASPSDVAKEREILKQVIEDWNAANSRDRGVVLRPLMWEINGVPSAGAPQDVLNHQLAEQADALFGIFWHRMGTPTKTSPSGTAEEIQKVRDRGKHVALYFCEQSVPMKHDQEQLKAVMQYRKDREHDFLFGVFDGPDELRRIATRHLAWIIANLSQDSESGAAESPAIDTTSGTSDVPDELDHFRETRLDQIRSGDTPAMVIPNSRKIVLHLVPAAKLRNVDFAKYENTLRMLLQPIGATGWDHRFTATGFRTFSEKLGNYVQCWNTGIIEAVECNLLDMPNWREMTNYKGPDFISTTDLEDRVIQAVSQYTQAQQRIAVMPPVYVLVSLLGIKGFRITTSGHTFSQHEIEEEDLLLRAAIIEEFGTSPENALRPIFDHLAQAAGLAGSRRYDRHALELL